MATRRKSKARRTRKTRRARGGMFNTAKRLLTRGSTKAVASVTKPNSVNTKPINVNKTKTPAINVAANSTMTIDNVDDNGILYENRPKPPAKNRKANSTMVTGNNESKTPAKNGKANSTMVTGNITVENIES